MNRRLKNWLDDRIANINGNNANYNDHVDQFLNKSQWNNVVEDCIALLATSIDYLNTKDINEIDVLLTIPLIPRNRFFADYDEDVFLDIPNFIHDSRHRPPSLYVYKSDNYDLTTAETEYYIRPIALPEILKGYDCTAIYICERSITDMQDDRPFGREVQFKCTL